jgi:monofunctional biosynthetic peptidoglycan transglycosylase
MWKFLKGLGWLSLLAVSLVIIAGGTLALLLLLTPQGTDLETCLTTELYKVRLCPKSADYVKLGQISAHAKHAIVYSEDAAFWDHQGIDWDELKKSFEINIEKGRFARGGSTITQQLAKNVYLSAEKSLWRKAREAIIALRIERLYEKPFILEKYLNVVEFGEGLYGIKPASQFYFRKSPTDLSLAESAFLAFLLPSPKRYAASFRKKQLSAFARRQTREIVDRLHRFKKISEPEKIQAWMELDTLFGGHAPLDLSDESMGEAEALEASEEFNNEGPTQDRAPKTIEESSN